MRRFLLSASFSLVALCAASAAWAAEFSYLQSMAQNSDYQFDGWATAVSGNFLLVGEPRVGGGPGAVRVYKRDAANAWNYLLTIDAPDTGNNNQFGAAVAIDGDTVVIGAPNAYYGGVIGSGRAYVFKHGYIYPMPPAQGYDYFALQTELVPPQTGSNYNFGFSVAVNGDIVAVGTPNAGRLSGKTFLANVGTVAVYRRDNGGTNAWGKVTTALGDLHANDQFGQAVALAPGRLVIGAPGGRVTPAGTTYNAGRAYFFNVAGDGSASYYFYVGCGNSYNGRRCGDAVAIDGSTVAVGAPVTANGHYPSVDIFYLDGAGIPQLIQQKTWLDNPTNNFGRALALRGSRLVVGAPLEPYFNFTNVGQAFLYQSRPGNTQEWDLVQRVDLDFDRVRSSFDLQDMRFGYSVAFDGEEIFVGAPLADYIPGAGVGYNGAVLAYSRDALFRNGFDCPLNQICVSQ